MNRRLLVWLGVFCLALAARTTYALWRGAAPNNDELAYVQLAQHMAEGEGFVRGMEPEVHVSPLFPSIHALSVRLTTEGQGTGILLALLISSLIPVAVGTLFERHFGYASGLTAALFIALHPYLIAFGRMIQPEGLTAVLYIWFLALWMRGNLEMGGIVLGLAYLSRPEAFLLMPPWVAIETWRRRHAPARVILAVSLFLLVCSPQLVYLKAATGRFCLSGKDLWVYVNGIAQVYTNNQPVPLELLRQLEKEVTGIFSHILGDPLLFLDGYLFRGRILLENLAFLITLPAIPLMVVGLFLCWTRSRSTCLVICFPLIILFIMPVGMTHRHHLLTVLPILVGMAGAGTALLGQRLYELWRPR